MVLWPSCVNLFLPLLNWCLYGKNYLYTDANKEKKKGSISSLIGKSTSQHTTKIATQVKARMYLLVLIQATEIGNQPVLLRLLGDPFCYGLGLALLRPIQDHKPRLHFTGHARKSKEKRGHLCTMFITKWHFIINNFHSRPWLLWSCVSARTWHTTRRLMLIHFYVYKLAMSTQVLSAQAWCQNYVKQRWSNRCKYIITHT